MIDQVESILRLDYNDVSCLFALQCKLMPIQRWNCL